jgi:DNA-nicking Smr family endonuclease
MANEDERIWSDYAKGVKRTAKEPVVKKPASFRGKPRSGENPESSRSLRKDSNSNQVLSSRLTGSRINSLRAFSGMTLELDRRAERKLRDGDIAIEARLDMHGMTQKESHAALSDFIAKQAKRGSRNLLVITGKGRDGGGVLKSNFANWLENLPDASRVLAVRTAAIKHGGTGAFYVILRKNP